ncbi:MAG TPA: CSLREA domain-containing protein, partial [Anaerolineae bacterium]
MLTSFRRARIIPALLFVFVVLSTQVPATQGAQTFTVNSTADAVDANPGDGVCATVVAECTLRAAIQEANGLAGADTITLPAGTYVLALAGANEDAAATGDLDITGDLTINGAGAATTTIDANGIDRVMHVPGGATVTIAGVTLSNGAATVGGGLAVTGGGNVTINQSIIRSNMATATGNDGGGGVYNSSSSLTLNDSTVRDNTANGGSGAGINNVSGASLVLNRSTVSGNSGTAPSHGGGLNNFGASATLNNSTISGNSASIGQNVNNWGGSGTTSMQLNHSTVHASTGSALTVLGSGTFTTELNHTLLSGPSGQTCDTSGAVTSLGHNLATDATCSLTQPTDLPNSDPLLQPLGDNGGLTFTHALQRGSPAIDAGNNAGCPDTDQRGTVRPQDGNRDGIATCDIGAFELTQFFFVTNTNDSGAGSLRQAILDANAIPNVDGEPDAIHFNIPGTGPHTIQPASALPAITDPVVIDGYTQPGAAPNTLAIGNNAVLQVVLSGASAGAGVNGLTITASDSTVRGLVINAFQDDGIE